MYWKVSKKMPYAAYIFFIPLLISCATLYQPEGLTGGYSETRIAENVWRVFFRGNGFTSQERAIDFALLRSAELCLGSGYRYFVVIEVANEKDVSYTILQTNIYAVTKPSSVNTVVCFTDRPTGYAVVYDARFVVEKYGL